MLSVYRAARIGDLDLVRMMIHRDLGIVHSTDENGMSALYWASDYGRMAVVSELLDHGAHISTTARNGWTPLHVACDSGRLEVVELLVRRRAKPTTTTSLMNHGHGCMRLVCGCVLRCMTVVGKLGKDRHVMDVIDAQDHCGQTALWLACYRGHEEILRLLLQAGADPMVCDLDDGTAKDIAIVNQHHECVQLIEVSGCFMRTGPVLRHDGMPLTSP